MVLWEWPLSIAALAQPASVRDMLGPRQGKCSVQFADSFYKSPVFTDRQKCSERTRKVRGQSRSAPLPRWGDPALWRLRATSEPRRDGGKDRKQVALMKSQASSGWFAFLSLFSNRVTPLVKRSPDEAPALRIKVRNPDLGDEGPGKLYPPSSPSPPFLLFLIKKKNRFFVCLVFAASHTACGIFFFFFFFTNSYPLFFKS